MSKIQIIFDTSAFISALLSKRGAAHRLLMLAGGDDFDLNLSVALVAEYEDVAKWFLYRTPLSELTLALAEKVSALATESYLEERSKQGSKAKFLAAMNKVADVKPEDDRDRL